MSWKRKIVLPLFLLCLLVCTSFMSRGASAAPAIPDTTTVCAGPVGCNGSFSWGNVSWHGIKSYFTIDNPGVSGNDWYQKYLELANYGSGEWMRVGIVKNRICGTGLYFFYSSKDKGFHCDVQVASLYYNTNILFALSTYASHGGGGFAYIYAAGSYCDPNGGLGPCAIADGALNTTYAMGNFATTFVKASFSGHAVWGGSFTGNQYFDGSNWHDMSTGPSTQSQNANGGVGSTIGCADGDTDLYFPPQICIYAEPNGSNAGGYYYSCEYDSDVDTCTLGS